MTLLFTGSELDAFLTDSTSTGTTAGHFHSEYSRGYFVCDDSHFLRSPDFAATSALWVHWSEYITGTGTSPSGMVLRGNDGTDYVRVVHLNDDLILQTWNGSSWDSIWNSGTNYTSALNDIDIELDNDVSGRLALYINGINRYANDGDYSSIDDIVSIEVIGRGSNNINTSEVVVSDEMTIGWHVYYREPTGNGDYTSWTGDYTDVDELALSDADYIESSSADEIELYTRAAISVPTGYEVKGLGVAIRGKNGATGPQNMQASLRFGSTDYVSSTLSLSSGFEGFFYMWETNPSTALAWTTADAGSATVQFGVKSIT